MKILNLTQYRATSSQLKAGVVDLPEDDRDKLQKLLTFDILPISKDIIERADLITEMAVKAQYDTVMIGGAPYMMSTLERSLHSAGINPVYAFSLCESTEQVHPDGSTQMTSVYRHIGFVIAV
jgi:hypothetical protein